ncbi:DUF3426 domain-containing protein [Lysobacter antibioticus]|uniref:DUF3426 domain-containing protein n=1 Tax=Lysobacter antibioticus TaxID=84531 RepID=UPI0009E036EC|nr:DUF3426 domain-containing protein [Lysobacter antibioticus]
MFAACPHCGYLVALIVAKDGPTRACPRCGGDLAAAAAIESAPAESTAVEPATNEPALVESAAIGAASAPVANAATGADALSAEASAAQASATPVQAGDTVAEHDQAGHLAASPEAATLGAQDAADASDDATVKAAPTVALAPLSAAADAVVPKRATRKRAGKSETAVAHARLAPSFVRSRARAAAPAARRHWSGPAVAVALGLLLALQLLLAQRNELAADARWRPLVGALCGTLPCTIPAWREPAALTMLNRNVLPVAERAGVLRVSASFRNDARWAQPWPTLVLSLEDVDGRRVGQRAFSPEDYRKGYREGELIAPGQSAAVQFDVLEPAPRVVAFTFDFR